MVSKMISCLLLFSFLHVINAKNFQFLNKLPEEIWVGCIGNKNYTTLHQGGWKLPSGQQVTISSPDHWAGKFWARTGCNPQTYHCLTGNCDDKLECNGTGNKPPTSLAEFKLKDENEKDYYDVSFVNGFNVEISIEPQGGDGDGTKYSCKKAACNYTMIPECPSELQFKNNGQVIACNSACDALHNEEYCCTGAHNSSETCFPSEYSKYFKDRCPDAYSYAYDDKTSTFTCNAPTYLITFGG